MVEETTSRFDAGVSKRPPVRLVVWLTHPDVECWNFSAHHEALLERELGGAVDVEVCQSRSELLEALSDAQVALVWEFEDEWLSRAPSLEWIATPAAGRERIRVRPRAGLTIDHGSFHGELMGETVIAFLLGHARGVFASIHASRRSPWPRAEVGQSMRPLRGSRVTILGFGAIGRSIAYLLVPFDCTIVGVKRSPAKPPNWFRRGRDRIVHVSALDEILPITDYLVVVLPADEETRHLIDARRLSLLPPHAAIVSVGRGQAIDEDALVEALDRRAIAAAYLDVYETEPLPADSLLRGREDVVLMPHASAIAPNYLDLFIEELAGRFRMRYPDRYEIS